MGESLFTFLLIIKHPKFAAVHGCLLNIIISMASVTYLIIRLWKVVWLEVSSEKTTKANFFGGSEIWENLIAVFITICGTAWITASYWRNRHGIKGARGIFIRLSKCLQRCPRLLTQPVWTVIIFLVVITFLCFSLFYINNCDTLKASKDFLFAQFEEDNSFLSSGYVLIFLIIILLWIIEITLLCQKSIVSGTVCQWYFCEEKSTLLHPISKSLFDTVFFHFGSVVACSLCGKLQYKLFVFMANKMIRKNRIADVDFKLKTVSSFTSYLSPIAPVSLGIYGRVQPTNICGDSYFDKNYFSKLGMPFFEKYSEIENHKATKKNMPLHVKIQNAHRAAKGYFETSWISFSCSSISVYYLFTDYLGIPVYVKFFSLFLTLILSSFICEFWLSILSAMVDALAICLFEDLDKNDGKNNLYFGTRGLLYRVTKAKLLLTQTRSGLKYNKKRRLEMEKQKEKEKEIEVAEAEFQNQRKKFSKKSFKQKKKSLMSRPKDKVRKFNVRRRVSISSRITSAKTQKTIQNSPIKYSEPLKLQLDRINEHQSSVFESDISLKRKNSLDSIITKEYEALFNADIEDARQKNSNKTRKKNLDLFDTQSRATHSEGEEWDNSSQITGFLPDVIPPVSKSTSIFRTKKTEKEKKTKLKSRTEPKTLNFEQTIWEEAMDF